MWDILDELPYDEVVPMLYAGSATIEKARLIASSYLDQRSVYVGQANNYFEAAEDDTLIVHRSDMILVHGVDTENVFDEICSIIERYRFWEHDLQSMVNHADGLQEMLDCSKDILKAPSFVYAPDGHAYAISEGYPKDIHWHWAEIVNNAGITSERMRSLRDSINLPNVWKDLAPKRRDSQMGDHQYMHCSLYPNGYMAGHLVLFGFTGPFRKGSERIVNVLVQYMTNHMEAFYSRYSPASKLIEAFTLLFARDVFDEDSILMPLRSLGWASDDAYRIYVFEELGEQDPVLIPQLSSTIAAKDPFTIPFVFDEQLVVLENESRTGDISLLSIIKGGEADFRCGVSLAFDDLGKTRVYYLQAKNEMERCRRTGETVSRAESHGMQQVMAALSDDALLGTYVARELVALKEYDERNGTSYYQTVRAYVVSCFHLSDAARFLGIHRNSLLYRLQKAREIESLTLVDEASSTHDEQKLNYLLLSFAIIDAQTRA